MIIIRFCLLSFQLSFSLYSVCQSVSSIRKMPCPFLTRLSTNYVRNYASTLLKTYGNQCPVVSRSISTLQNPPIANVSTSANAANSVEPAVQDASSSVSRDTKCPFLASPSAANIIRNLGDAVEDIPSERAFEYENFFHEQIQRKKKDHSYRVFKKVSRLAGIGEFPKAFEYSWGEKPITVWW